MQRAFRSICKEPGFAEHLEKTLQRISDIESLGRTRELVAKDLVLGGRYVVLLLLFGFGLVVRWKGEARVRVRGRQKERKINLT
jgi:hypothetical protein